MLLYILVALKASLTVKGKILDSYCNMHLFVLYLTLSIVFAEIELLTVIVIDLLRINYLLS